MKPLAKSVWITPAASTAGAQRTRTLSVNSVNAIRASMDTAMVRENQRLQKQMVLLTIAISGGPFIGLFGTVMGVMITFAEVALAGNVDVNAIAPGISCCTCCNCCRLSRRDSSTIWIQLFGIPNKRNCCGYARVC